MLTITLSGPEAAEQEARVALAGAGFTVLDYYHHNLGVEVGTAFVSVRGEDINLANDCVGPFGWRLRMHEQAIGDDQ